MANTKAVRFNAPKFQPVTGAAAHFADYANVTAAAVSDTFDWLIPAGVEVSSVVVQTQGALDTNGSPTLAFKLGYLPADSTSSLAAVDNYFAAAGNTGLRAGGRITCAFEPITFNEDVIVRMTITTAAATIAAGRLWTIVSGNCNGPK
jgi:hypothetical protein